MIERTLLETHKSKEIPYDLAAFKICNKWNYCYHKEAHTHNAFSIACIEWSIFHVEVIYDFTLDIKTGNVVCDLVAI